MKVAVIHERCEQFELESLKSVDLFDSFEQFSAKFPIHRKCIEPILLVAHGSNNEFRKLAPSSYFKSDPPEHLLPYLMKRICQDGGRVLIVSGGTPEHIHDAQSRLEAEGFKERHHFLTSISRGDIDWTKLPRYMLLDWRVEEVTRQAHSTYDVLLSLAILCQGFLIVTALSSSSTSPELNEALALLRWTEFLEQNSAELPLGKNALEEVKSPNWWRIEGLDEFAGKLLSGSNELWSAQEASSLLALVRQILEEQEMKTNTVARAFLSLARTLKQELE